MIQNAYKRYKDKKRQQTQRQREIEAACLIQSYYRRYKQVWHFTDMEIWEIGSWVVKVTGILNSFADALSFC